jgi:hypothetical protein
MVPELENIQKGMKALSELAEDSDPEMAKRIAGVAMSLAEICVKKARLIPGLESLHVARTVFHDANALWRSAYKRKAA